MKKLLYSILFISLTLLSGYSYSESRKTEEVRIHVINFTKYNLSVIDKKLWSGSWVREPSTTVNTNHMDIFITKRTPTSGTEGYVEYSIYDGSFKVHWNYDHEGRINNHVVVNDPKRLYKIDCDDCNTNEFTIVVIKK